MSLISGRNKKGYNYFLNHKSRENVALNKSRIDLTKTKTNVILSDRFAYIFIFCLWVLWVFQNPNRGFNKAIVGFVCYQKSFIATLFHASLYIQSLTDTLFPASLYSQSLTDTLFHAFSAQPSLTVTLFPASLHSWVSLSPCSLPPCLPAQPSLTVTLFPASLHSQSLTDNLFPAAASLHSLPPQALEQGAIGPWSSSLWNF